MHESHVPCDKTTNRELVRVRKNHEFANAPAMHTLYAVSPSNMNREGFDSAAVGGVGREARRGAHVAIRLVQEALVSRSQPRELVQQLLHQVGRALKRRVWILRRFGLELELHRHGLERRRARVPGRGRPRRRAGDEQGANTRCLA